MINIMFAAVEGNNIRKVYMAYSLRLGLINANSSRRLK